MKIKNQRHFAYGIIAVVLAAVCFGAHIVTAFEMKLLISGILLLLLAAVSFVFAFSKKGLEEEILGTADERDIYLAMKSGQTTVKILNYLLFFGCLVSLLLYGILRNPLFITVSLTLCVVLVLLFITMLAVNSYYEKRV